MSSITSPQQQMTGVSARPFAADDFMAQIENLVASIANLPFTARDILAGNVREIDDTPTVMIPVRETALSLTKLMKKLPGEAPASTLEGFRHFAKVLTDVVRTRHHVDNPAIFQVTRETATPTFLENLIQKESVHAFADGVDGKDLDTRMNHPNRAIYAWRDPYDADRALISIQVALTDGMGRNIHDVLGAKDFVRTIDTGTPYSISNWGSVEAVAKPFIYGVAATVRRLHPSVKQIVTLSPLNGFAAWLAKHPPLGSDPDRKVAEYVLARKHTDEGYKLENLAATAHLGNGAIFVRLQAEANPGDAASLGYMANFRYPNSEQKGLRNLAAYQRGEPARSPEIAALLRGNYSYRT
ncbi:MAG: malonyl-CoA decarboxylase family protein [Pseudomonadota bacterium]|nr:malonyl-CoA decarboxylase family protein [Pseudomonadota bacterium]